MARSDTNSSNIGLQGRIPGEIEMAALEDLGPRTRSALCNSPLKILATAIISQVVEYNDKVEAENQRRLDAAADTDLLQLVPYLDPKDPLFDARLAAGVLNHNIQLLLKDAVPIEDARAACRPLRGQPSPKSIREQRRAMRRVRW